MLHIDKLQIISISSIITKTQIPWSHPRVYVLNLFTIILPDIKIEHVLVWVNINESFSEIQENNYWPLESDVWWVSFFRLSKIYAGKAVVWSSLVQIEQGRTWAFHKARSLPTMHIGNPCSKVPIVSLWRLKQPHVLSPDESLRASEEHTGHWTDKNFKYTTIEKRLSFMHVLR